MNEIKEVTWNVLRIDPDQKIIVKFTNGDLENEVWYKWEGDIEAIRQRIISDAINYRDIWWKIFAMSDNDQNQILALSGSSADINVTTNSDVPSVIQITI